MMPFILLKKRHEQVELYNSFINDVTVAANQRSPIVRRKDGISTIRTEVDEIKKQIQDNERIPMVHKIILVYDCVPLGVNCSFI